MARTILIMGGARSGKSRYAEKLAEAHAGARIYLATGQAGDEEMENRIEAHRARRGKGWITVEEPLELTAALRASAAEGVFILVECLTMWLTNLILNRRDVAGEVEDLCEVVRALPGVICFVSNEVGLGVVPETALGRYFRDEAGFANQMIAEAADEAVFMVAGLPMRLKG